MKRAWLVVCLAAAAGCQPCVDYKPAPYQCAYGGAADQCRGGWKCGVAGLCFDPDAGAALPCNTTADCPSDWRCGEARVCFDPADGGALPCLWDAGANDCANGWRCGLNDVCHAIGVGAPYACTNDSDCEASWRCDVSTQGCVNVPDEIIPPASGIGALGAQRTNPILRLAPATAISAAPPETVSAFVVQTRPGILATAVDGGFVWATVSSLASPAVEGGGFTAWPRPILNLSVAPSFSGGAVFVLDSAGMWQIASPGADAGLVRSWNGENHLRRFTVPIRVSCGFKCTYRDYEHLLLSFSSNSFSLMDEGGAFAYSGQTLPASDGGQQVINDMAFGAWLEPGAEAVTSTWLFAAGDEGVFATPAVPAGSLSWAPFSDHSLWTNAQCSGDMAPDLRRLESFTGSSFLGDDGGGNWIGGLFGRNGGTQWGVQPNPPLNEMIGPLSCNYTTPVPLGQYGEYVGDPQLAICPPGFDVDHLDGPVALPNPDAGYTLFATCRPDGGASSGLLLVRGAVQANPGVFSWQDLSGPSGFYSDLALEQQDFGGFLAGTGAHGQVWLDPQSGAYPIVLFLDGAGSSLGWYADGGTVITGRGAVYVQSAFGLESLPDSGTTPEIFVEGRPDLLLTMNGSGPLFGSGQVVDPTGQTTVATLDGTLSQLAEPFHAQAIAIDGGLELLVTSASSIYANQLQPPLVPQLSLRATLPFGVPITSVTFPPAQGGHLIDGYVLSNEGVFRVTVENQETWVVTQVPVPAAQHWIKVWSDAARPRVGYEDGTVLGLPLAVRLAPAIAFSGGCSGEQVLDYADLCGQAFALSNCNLYRLVPDGIGGGTWAPEPAPWPVGFADRDLAGGSLLPLAPTLYITSRFGEAVAINPVGACP